MRKPLIVLTLVIAAVSWTSAQRAPAPAPAAMLTVDSIMRGPKLVGTPPSAVRWSKDGSTIYFTWQRASDDRSATWQVGRDGTGLRQLSPEEATSLDVAPAGRFDRARRRVLTAENGDVVIYDRQTGERRQVTRTSAAETNPRWARGDTAVTFMRDGNLYLVSLDTPPAASPMFAQLTDIVVADAAAAAGGGAGRAAGAGRGGQAGAASGETEIQRLLREQERQLIDFIRKQQEDRAAVTAGGAAGVPAGPRHPPSDPSRA